MALDFPSLLLGLAFGAVVGGWVTFRAVRFFFRSSGAGVRVVLSWLGVPLPTALAGR